MSNFQEDDWEGQEHEADRPGRDRKRQSDGPRADNLQAFHDWLDERYEFRYNLLVCCNEYRETADKENEWREIDDYDLNSIEIEAKLEGWRYGTPQIDKYAASKYVAKHHPITDYFAHLRKEYKGKLKGTKNIEMLARTITVRKGQEKYWPALLKRWLISAVAQMTGRGSNHTCLVLHGGQGVGKSTWLNRLLPAELQPYQFEGHVEPNVKDPNTAAYLCEKAIINIDDQLDTLLGRDFNEIKSMFTIKDVTSRKAYARKTKKRSRIASFVASVNGDDFLTDSDNRRYLVFTCEKIDYGHELLMDLVWAEAQNLLESGKEPPYLTAEEKEWQQAINAEYAASTVEASLLIGQFEPGIEGHPETLHFEPSDLLLELQRKAPTVKLWPRNLGTALKRYGFEKKQIRLPKYNNQPRGVWLVRPKVVEVSLLDTQLNQMQ